MRPGQQQHQQKRMRGRNNNNNNRKGPNPLSRSYESNGPDVKIRGNAAHIADKYVQLARDATSSGDPVAAENYLQHAEHYYRIVMANQPQYPQGQAFVRADDESRDEDGDEDGNDGSSGGYDNQQPNGYQQNAPQPYQNNGGEGGQQRRDYQPREQRDHQPREPRQQNNQNYNNGPREQRESREQHQPREPREQHQQREPREQREPQGGLPAFITGGAAPEPQAQNVQGEIEGGGEGASQARGRGRRRFNNRYGRTGEQSAPEGGAAPNPEPEVAPGE